MLSWIRTLTKSWVSPVLFGLLVVSFAVWGVRSSVHTKLSDWVVKAGDHEIGSQEFKNTFDNVLRDAGQRQGQPISPTEAARQGGDVQILDELAAQESVGEYARRTGVQPSKKLLLSEIAKVPAFFNPVTNKFDPQAYQRVLQQNNTTVARFEADGADRIAEAHIQAALGAGLVAPRTYTALFGSYIMESRNAAYFLVDQKTVPAPVKPTDPQLVAFMRQHATELRQPELRIISMVRLSAQALAPTLTLDQTEVQKRYDFAKDRLSQPEKRSFIQVPANNAAQAAQIAGRLQHGEDPAAVARSMGVQPVVYTDTAKSSVPDPRVADAAFSMAAGQTSGPIQGEFRYAVVRVGKITPGHAVSLEEARPQIEAAMRASVAEDRVIELSQKYDDSHSGGANLAAAAKTAGVQVYTLGPITAQGVDGSGRPNPALTAKMLQDAFATPQGGETDMVQISRGEYYALRVERVIPSALPTLDQARGPLTQRFMLMDLIAKLRAKADELAERVRKGESIDAVAASIHAKAEKLEGLSAATARAHAALGQDFLGRILQAKRNDVLIAPGTSGIYVAKIETIQAAPAAQVAFASNGQRQAMDQQLLGEIAGMGRSAARAMIKPKIDLARARQAIDVSTDDVPLPGKSDTPAKPAKAK